MGVGDCQGWEMAVRVRDVHQVATEGLPGDGRVGFMSSPFGTAGSSTSIALSASGVSGSV